MPDRFERWARHRPDAPAVIQEGRTVTYRQLDRLANGLAMALRADGVDLGHTVGVCVERSPEMLVALLGILKCGGTYVPVDPAWPDERLRTALADAGCACLVSDQPAALSYRLAGSGCPVLPVDGHTARDVGPGSRADAHSIACINFTSGSTGRPKGVLIRHRGINRLVHGATYGTMDEHSRVLQVTPVTFDIATWEIWGALLTGGVSVMYPAEFIRIGKLSQVMKAGGVNILLLATALFNSVVDEAPKALDTVATITTGGEAPSIRHMVRAVQRYGTDRVVHLYGPTECTCTATFHPLGRVPRQDAPLPIGRPIQNTRVYLLNEEADRLCEPGETGEICLAGDGLAAGYLRLPELTAQRFIERDIGGTVERLYRTGDWGHLEGGGDVVFDGRRDDQVKVNTFRIELGEITHHLNHHPAVQQSAVAVQDTNGERSLIAFVVPTDTGAVSPDQLRAHLAAKLPHYMVPALVQLCDVFPLTPNGKIDRNALLTAHVQRQRQERLPHE